MSVAEIYDNDNISKLEARFAVDEISHTGDRWVFMGKYPLQPFKEGARGTYGGEFVSQGIVAAWETVKDHEMSPHSLHSYFIKAGSQDSPIRWEVQEANNGRNYANRLVQGYQSHTNKLVFTIQISFSKKNHIKQRETEYANQQAKIVEIENKDMAEKSVGVPKLHQPFHFQRKPMYYFDKYRDKLDDLPFFEHTYGHLQHIVPPELFAATNKADFESTGNVHLGFFVRANDDLSLAKDANRARIIDLAFASDSFYLSLVINALGLSLPTSSESEAARLLNFFRVSLDHSLFFHDIDFDPTDWLFLEFKYARMSNDRILCKCYFYTRDGRLVCSVVQEALVFLSKEITDKANEFNENSKRENEVDSLSAKL